MKIRFRLAGRTEHCCHEDMVIDTFNEDSPGYPSRICEVWSETVGNLICVALNELHEAGRLPHGLLNLPSPERAGPNLPWTAPEPLKPPIDYDPTYQSPKAPWHDDRPGDTDIMDNPND